MSRAFPTTISARLTRHQLSNVLRCAERARQSPSTFVRGLLAKFSDAATGTGDPDKALAAIKEALGFDPSADVDTDDLSEAFAALLEEINSDPSADPGDEAGAEMADPVPPKPGAANPPAPPKKNPAPPASLSKYEIAECAKQGIDLADYAMRRDRAARRVSAEPVVERPMKLSRETKAILRAQGRSDAEFLDDCARAVKRV